MSKITRSGPRCLALAAALASLVCARPAPADPGPAADGSGGFDRVLSATVITPEGRTALLWDESGGLRTVHPGDVVDGWRVKAIEAREVTMAPLAATEGEADRSVTLRLQSAVADGAPPALTPQQRRHQEEIINHQGGDPDALRRE